MKIPVDLKYTADHEWVKLDGNTATIGITDFAQSQLGEIVFVEIETEGETLESHSVFGTVEAVKTVSDLFMPLAGKILEVNSALNDAPDSVNNDPYGDGWMVKIAVTDSAQLTELLTAEQYKSLIG